MSQWGLMRKPSCTLGDFTPCAGLMGITSHPNAKLSICFRTFNTFRTLTGLTFTMRSVTYC